MNILFVGDNRNRRNWGCRATSMALGSLLGCVGEIGGVLDGKEVSPATMTPVPFGGRSPQRLWNSLYNARRGPLSFAGRFLKAWFDLEDDFVCQRPAVSVQRFLNVVHRYPWMYRFQRAMEGCDVVVINGEGDYIYTTPPRRKALFYDFVLCLAEQLGKPRYVVNAMFSECPQTGMNVDAFQRSLSLLEACNAVVARDPQSCEFLQSRTSLEKLHYVPDALFTWRQPVGRWKEQLPAELRLLEPFGAERYTDEPSLDLNSPYVCLSGSSRASWDQQAAYAAYRPLIERLRQLDVPLLITPACDGDEFLVRIAADLAVPCLPVQTPIRACAAIVANAEVFVSGRFHPSILASLGGTPCVFLGSNSHKTLSLQRILEYESPREYSALPDVADVDAIVGRVEELLAAPGRGRIDEVVGRRSREAQGLVSLLQESLAPKEPGTGSGDRAGNCVHHAEGDLATVHG